MKRLSKSKLLSFHQCSKRLWLDVHRRELIQHSSEAKSAMSRGQRVGELAQAVFDSENKGVLIDPFTEGWPEALIKTEELIAGGEYPVFEGTFTDDDILVMADIMIPADNGSWDIIEVKSSTSVKAHHLLDLAIQIHVLEARGVKVNRCFVASINNRWVYQGNGDYSGLFRLNKIDFEAGQTVDNIDSIISLAREIVMGDEPKIETGEHCTDPFECPFLTYCNKGKELGPFPVQWLPDVRTKALKDYIESNQVKSMNVVPDNLLNNLQLRVKQYTQIDKAYTNYLGAKKKFNRLTWPLRFLDFETVNLAIPIWKGVRPYERIPFQYSNHCLSENGTLKHTHYLDVSSDDPRKGFINKLILTCGTQGSILVYNVGFEQNVLLDLAEAFPKKAQQLNAIADRLFDLLPVVRDNYYHPSQQGSWSIKRVLPAILSQESYAELDGVQDGSMAMEAYIEAINENTSRERKAEIQRELLDYCALDTLAMVKIWEFFDQD